MTVGCLFSFDRYFQLTFLSGCTDVVKKPKLDQHANRCRASFTCVDCSKTFRNQREWKGHTSCITEAEKYQKGLYKGKKHVRDMYFYAAHPVSNNINIAKDAAPGPRGGHKATDRPALVATNVAVKPRANGTTETSADAKDDSAIVSKEEGMCVSRASITLTDSHCC